MSLYGALFSGVSGMSAFSRALGGISDNISNVSTTGYKRTGIEFSTQVTGTNSRNVYNPGGVRSTTRAMISQQGLLQTSNSNTDLAIQGRGFFVVSSTSETQGSDVKYTRAGAFNADADGLLRNTANYYLRAWPTDVDGNITGTGSISDLVPVQAKSIPGTAVATTEVTIKANLLNSTADYTGAYAAGDMSDSDVVPPPANAVTPDLKSIISVYDKLGGRHDITIAFKKVADKTWNVEAYVSPQSSVSQAKGLLTSGQILFNNDGSLDQAGSTAALFSEVTATWVGAPESKFTLNLGRDNAFDGLTSFAGTKNEVSSSIADGASYGKFTELTFSDDGTISANFENGYSRPIYKIPLATFLNPDGLIRRNGGVYESSAQESNNPQLLFAKTNATGSINSSALEASNVDLGNEFSNLIVMQRGFEASSKVIMTSNEMLQTLNQIIR